MTYSVVWSEQAVSAGSRYLTDDRAGLAHVLETTDHLAGNPRPAGAFPYGSDNLLRIRVGRYRVLYEIDPVAQSITVLHVGRVA